MATKILKGTPISAGVAIGPAVVVEQGLGDIQIRHLEPDEVEREIERFELARARVEVQLDRMRTYVEKKSDDADALIFAAQKAVIQDASIHETVDEIIRSERIGAEGALQRQIAKFDEMFSEIDDFRQLGSEMRDPWRLVLQDLAADREAVMPADAPRILVTDQLTPSLLARVHGGSVLGIAVTRGNRYSHGGILAQALGIPAVSGLPNLTATLESGTAMIVSGDTGEVLIEPRKAELRRWARRQSDQDRKAQWLVEKALEPAATADGKPVEVLLNVETLRDLEDVDVGLADGVGLLRTEFLYMERRVFPSENEQVGIYREALGKAHGKPVVFRTLDIGGDKRLPYFQMPEEENPAMGWRGLRVSMAWRDLFYVQLRALLRASAAGPVKILLPMVTTASEVKETRSILEGLKEDLRRAHEPFDESVAMGAMLEVPAAALSLEQFIGDVDFLSIGTNDLVQYMLAVDRDNPWVAGLYDPMHPAVLGLIRSVAKTAQAHQVPLSVCGEMAGDPGGALLLLGLGIRSLSMSPVMAPVVKGFLHAVLPEEADEVAGLALRESDATGVARLVDKRTAILWSRIRFQTAESKRR